MDKFEALAEPTRRTIVEILATSGRLPASRIYNHFHTSHPAISQHLRVLREAHIVIVEKRAQQRIYEIDPHSLYELQHWIEKMSKLWQGRFDRLHTLLKEERNHAEAEH